jgi:phosphoribosyl 1,2-cyclic phosphodiesterase
MLDFRALASSSAGCAYHLASGSHPPLLLDAGLRFVSIQQALGYQVGSLAGVLLTHAHGDHMKAVPDLLRFGVDVYASEETWEAISPKFRHCAHTVEALTEFTVGPWTVKPFGAVHDSPGTLGFVIAGPDGGRLLYLTDTGYSKHRFDGLTHLAVECNHSREIIAANTLAGTLDVNRFRRTSENHLSIEVLEKMLLANDLSQVEETWLLHLSDENSDERAFRQRIQRITGTPVHIAPKVLSL